MRAFAIVMCAVWPAIVSAQTDQPASSQTPHESKVAAELRLEMKVSRTIARR